MLEAYKKLLEAFSSRHRPEHFTNYGHCEECLEHDETLISKDNDTVSFNDVGNISYTPISFISAEGFLYYLPGLARLAGGTGNAYYLDTFLTHLERQDFRNLLNTQEKAALAEYLDFLKNSIYEDVKINLDEEDLDELTAWLRRA